MFPEVIFQVPGSLKQHPDTEQDSVAAVATSTRPLDHRDTLQA